MRFRPPKSSGPTASVQRGERETPASDSSEQKGRRENVSAAAAAGGERGVVPGQGAHSGHHEPPCEARGVRRPRSHRAAGHADREGAPRGRYE